MSRAGAEYLPDPAAKKLHDARYAAFTGLQAALRAAEGAK